MDLVCGVAIMLAWDWGRGGAVVCLCFLSTMFAYWAVNTDSPVMATSAWDSSSDPTLS